MIREKVLVVDKDLDTLSRIYLALVHRKFKTEACNKPEEITERLKRFKPAVIILPPEEYTAINKKLKIPAIVVLAEGEHCIELGYGDIQIKKPVQVEAIIKAIEQLV